MQVAKFLTMLDKERNRKEFTAEKLWQLTGTKKELDDDDDSNLSDNFLEDKEDLQLLANNERSKADLLDMPDLHNTSMDLFKEKEFNLKGKK